MQRPLLSWMPYLAAPVFLLGLAGCHLMAGFGDLEPTGEGGATASGTGGTTSSGTGGTGGATSSGGGGGNVPTFTVGGAVAGLRDNATISLANNDTDEVDVDQNGPFVFPTPLPNGASYHVMETSYIGDLFDQLCVVQNEHGQISGENITDVAVECLNAEAHLSALTLSEGTLTTMFQQHLTSYEASVTGVQDITVTPTSVDPKATIMVDEYEVASGTESPPIHLDQSASTTIVIIVQAEWPETTMTYGLDVTVTQQ